MLLNLFGMVTKSAGEATVLACSPLTECLEQAMTLHFLKICVDLQESLQVCLATQRCKSVCKFNLWLLVLSFSQALRNGLSNTFWGLACTWMLNIIVQDVCAMPIYGLDILIIRYLHVTPAWKRYSFCAEPPIKFQLREYPHWHFFKTSKICYWCDWAMGGLPYKNDGVLIGKFQRHP